MADWMSFMNFKISIFKFSIENDKKPRQPCQDIVPFTTRETEKHLACYMLHELDLLQTVEFKLKSHIIYLVNGNDFLNRVMGANTVRRQKHFK